MNTKIEIKSEYYLNLLLNREQLINSSQSIIRKKRSPLAREIAKGNVDAITQAAKDRVRGTLTKEQRGQVCKIFCEAKHKSSKVIGSEGARDVLSWVINALIGTIDTASGLMVSFLWIIVKQLKDIICICKLTGECFKGICAEMV